MVMTWNDVLINVVDLAFKAVLTLVLPWAVSLISHKIKNERAKRLIAKGEDFVMKSIQMVQQTFVDSLKKEGKFDADAQREAYKLCYERWFAMASDEVKAAILEEVGDLDAWLNTMIESGIVENKMTVTVGELELVED